MMIVMLLSSPDRCDARVDCYRIRDDRYDNISSYSLHDEVSCDWWRARCSALIGPGLHPLHHLQHPPGGRGQQERGAGRDQPRQPHGGVLAHQREDAGHHPERRPAAPHRRRAPHLLLPQQESQEVINPEIKSTMAFGSEIRTFMPLYFGLFFQLQFSSESW